MAKRDAPEINAGSMADIAFLLLIFFLVTTTMDKDTAFRRNIPKLIEVSNPPPTEKKDVYPIAINSKQEIKVKMDSVLPVEEIENLHKRIIHFYEVNRYSKFDDFNKDYPYYSSVDGEYIEGEITKLEEDIEAYQGFAQSEGNDEKIANLEDQIGKWDEKFKNYNIYAEALPGRPKMPEISIAAHVKILPFNDTDYDAYIAIQSEIEKALTILKNKEAERLFGIDFTTMKTYFEQNALEDTPIVEQYKKRLELLEVLYPTRIIEVTPTR